MVEAIVTSAQPLQFFFFFPMLFSSIRLVMCKEFRGNTLFSVFPKKGRFSRNSVAILAHHKTE